MNDIPEYLHICKCGHRKCVHSGFYDFPICEECANKRIDDWRHTFKLDNLRHLEILADE